MRFAVIVPVLNPGPLWKEWVRRLSLQTIQPDLMLVVDSESTDGALQHWQAANQQIRIVKRSDFNHGGTRQWAVEQVASQVDVVVFLTQDALLDSPDALQRILEAFLNPTVAVAYGRQLPHQAAGAIGAHARLFNYDARPRMKSKEQIPKLGIKTCFNSNSFAAYRVKDLLALGGFPRHVILSEDTYVAAKAVLADKSVAYVADATVHHSHDYTAAEEFRRYFDIGVFHTSEPWLMQKFGGAEGEGLAFVRSELRYLLVHAPFLIPLALFRSFAKWTGYRLGKLYRHLPVSLCRCLSMHQKYWDQSQARGAHA